MHNILKSNQGITLVELLITLALLGIVLALGFNYYFFGSRTFEEGETRANVQREMRLAADDITRQLRLAHSVEFKNDVEEDLEEGDNFIFFDEDDGIIHRYYDEEKEEEVERIILDRSFEEIEYGFEFLLNNDNNNEGDKLKDVVYFNIKADAINYEVESAVLALNIPPEEEISGEPPSEAVYFSGEPEFDEPPEGEDPPDDCFVANAVFDSENSSPLNILRNFRDNYLLTNALGQSVVDVYYRYSPALASFIEQEPYLQEIGKILLIPVVAYAYALMYHTSLLLTVLVMSLIIGVIFYKKPNLHLI